MNTASTSLQNPSRSNWWTWWICILLMFGMAINYMDRLTLNLTQKLVREAFNMDEGHYGQLESAFAVAFAVGSIIFGWLADRVSIRWLYPAALVAWSVAGMSGGLAMSFGQLLVCRFMLGFFEGSNMPCGLCTTQRILPPAKRPMGNSLLQGGAAVGSVTTPLLVYLMVDEKNPDSWRPVFLAVGAFGIFWAFLWLPSVCASDLALPRRGGGPGLIQVVGWLSLLLVGWMAAHSTPVAERAPWAPLVSTVAVTCIGTGVVFLWLWNATRDDRTLPRHAFFRRFWVLVVFVVGINTTWHFLRPWLPVFLQSQRHYSIEESSNFFMAYYAAADVGSLSAGFLSLWLIRKGWTIFSSRVLVFSFFVALTLSALLISELDGAALVVLLLVIAFSSLGLFPVYYSFSQELTSEHQGKMTGCLSCINWLVMALLQEVVGEWVKSTQSYTAGFALAALSPVAALTAIFFFWRPEQTAGTQKLDAA